MAIPELQQSNTTTDWKPDFSKTNPWEGMPINYAGIATFKPTDTIKTPPWEGQKGSENIPKFGTPEFERLALSITKEKPLLIQPVTSTSTVTSPLVSDINKRVEQYNRDSTIYTSDLNAFNNKWQNYIQNEKFIGSSEQFDIYNKEFNDLRTKFVSLNFQAQEINTKTGKLSAIDSDYLQLKDGYILKTEFSSLPEKYQNIAVNDGFDAMQKAILEDNKSSAKTALLDVFQQYKLKDGSYNLKQAIRDGIAPHTVEQIFGKEVAQAAEIGAKNYTFGELPAVQTAKQVGTIAAEVIIPGVYTIKEWNNLTGAERAFSIALDVASVVPVIGQIGQASRGVYAGGKAIAAIESGSRSARLAEAGKMAGRIAFEQIKAPVNIIIHPLETVKGIGRTAYGLAETVLHPAKIPEAVLTTSSKIARININANTTPAEAMQARKKIAAIAAREGSNIVVQTKQATYELVRSPFMREVKGGLVHATPDVRVFETPTVVKAKAGMPAEEQGLFFATEPATHFTQNSAFGKGIVPVPANASDIVRDIGMYLPEDLVKIDKLAVRKINLADAKSMPENLAKPFEQYIRANDGQIAGSFSEWLKVQNAMKPNDLDLVFPDRNKAIADLVKVAEQAGYKAQRDDKGIQVLQDGKWTRVAEVRSQGGFKAMLPEGLSVEPNKVEGIKVTRLGEQYYRQSLGSVTLKDVKAPLRGQKLKRTAIIVRDLLREAGYAKRRPGILVIGQDKAVRTVSSDKIFANSAEIESKLLVGEKTPAIKQFLFTRIGSRGERVEILLDNPLSASQIAKLKAEGLVEWFKAPFKPPIKVNPRISGLTAGEKFELQGILIESKNYEAARELTGIRNETTSRMIRAVPRSLDRITRNEARISSRQRTISDSRITRAEARARNSIDRVPTNVNRVTGIPDKAKIETPVRIPPVPPRINMPPPRVVRPPEKLRPPDRIDMPDRFVKPPKQPPIYPPTGSKAETKESRELTGKPPIAIRQGFNWIVIEPPYKQENIHWQKHAPPGAVVAKGIGSAYRTIQALGGDANVVLSIKMGFETIDINRPKSMAGASGTVKFSHAPKRSTDLTLKGVSAL